MRLEKVTGMHPRYQAQQIFYNRDPKISREILYCQANMLVGYYPPTESQRHFFDEHLASIDSLLVERDFAITA